uniref:Uncharacterized protein n=1 Tax=Timema monikensis TaxID=170555 RepID=A0A7R9EFT7_9NEOP|nr:unnamed protein product [Timema monikensis]
MTLCCLLFSNQLVESLSQHQPVATLVLDRAENITDATLKRQSYYCNPGEVKRCSKSPCLAKITSHSHKKGGGSLEEDSEDQDHTSLRESVRTFGLAVTNVVDWVKASDRVNYVMDMRDCRLLAYFHRHQLVAPLAAGWSVILSSAGRYDPSCLSHRGLLHNHVVCTSLMRSLVSPSHSD